MKPPLSTVEAAPLIGLKPQSCRALRSKGGGPPYLKLAVNRVVYREEDIAAWHDSKLRTSSSDPGPGPAGRP
jgi:predicted DNA-binding transcriptional regulator AlpA